MAYQPNGLPTNYKALLDAINKTKINDKNNHIKEKKYKFSLDNFDEKGNIKKRELK